MRSLICGLCFTVVFASGALAQTASVQPVQGDLSLNQGQGFQRVDSRIAANVGDSVMVGPGGSASLVYPDGCQVTVQPGAVVSIAPLSPCASGSLAADSGIDWGAVALGVGAAAVTGLAIAGISSQAKSTAASQ